MDKFISDIECPYCGSIHTTISDTDELEFAPDGTGFYSPDVYCFDCKKDFRPWYDFKYSIIREYIRK